MQRSIRSIVARLALGLTVAGAAVAPASPAAAATSSVDVTIAETIPVTTGSLAAGSLPGCPSAVVHTENGSAVASGPATIFSGDKRFDCGGGNELTLHFVAVVVGCSSYDFGTWRAVSGTGTYAGVRGSGVLVGSYTSGGAPSNACAADGVLDRYRGVLRT